MKNMNQRVSMRYIRWEYGENIGINNQKETKTTIFNTRMVIKKRAAFNSILHLFYVHFVYLLGASVQGISLSRFPSLCVYKLTFCVT